MTTISWGSPFVNTGTALWDWSSSPQVVNIGTEPSVILEPVSEPRLVSYRVDAPSTTKIRIWKNAPVTGEHEQDSHGGHNISDWELISGLKLATVDGSAKVVVNTATKIII